MISKVFKWLVAVLIKKSVKTVRTTGSYKHSIEANFVPKIAGR